MLPLDDSLTSGTIAGNVQNIREGIRRAAIRVGRDPSTVQLVAATKTVPSSVLFEAYAAGLRIFGENRLQEAQRKMPEIGPRQGLAWHFIGRMQSRKLKNIVGNFAMIHSVESVEQTRRIAVIAEKLGIRQDILLEVNVSGEEAKGGFLSEEVPKAVEDIGRLPHVTLRGLMTLPPFGDNPEEVRPYFSKLRQLRDSLVQHGAHAGIEELSMGMSHDYHIAIEEGATMVRIGTAIFGKRG
ncbi:MAG: YggS family pyridoxal phosphate-dependent enzyme [Nitrospirales bacterium]